MYGLLYGSNSHVSNACLEPIRLPSFVESVVSSPRSRTPLTSGSVDPNYHDEIFDEFIDEIRECLLILRFF